MTDAGSHAVRLRDGLAYGAAVFVAVLAGWSVLGLIGVQIFPAAQGVGVPGLDAEPLSGGWHNLLQAGNRADALWYQRIAESGYRVDDSSAAFFPLYPLIVHLVTLIGVPTLAAAIVVAQLSFLGALVVMYALTTREFGTVAARPATRFLAVFPSAFFFLAPFTESLFLLLTLLVFWYARGDRWWQAALFAVLAGLTRSVGIVLVVALLVEVLRRRPDTWRGWGPRLTAVVAPGVGLALYGLYWAVVHGHLTAPLDAQKTWQREVTFPLETLWSAVEHAWKFQGYWMIDLLVVLVVVAAIVAGARLLPVSYVAYAVTSMLLPLSDVFSDRPLMSMPRFVVVLFPAFMALAVLVQRRRLSDPLVMGVFAGGYVLLGLLFMNNYAIF